MCERMEDRCLLNSERLEKNVELEPLVGVELANIARQDKKEEER